MNRESHFNLAVLRFNLVVWFLTSTGLFFYVIIWWCGFHFNWLVLRYNLVDLLRYNLVVFYVIILWFLILFLFEPGIDLTSENLMLNESCLFLAAFSKRCSG